MSNNINSLLLTDGYKTSHHLQYPKGTSLVFSGFTPRTDKYAPNECKGKGVVVFGVQMALQWLKEHFDENFFFTRERKYWEENNTGKGGFVDTLNAGELEKLKIRAIQPVKEELEMYLNAEYDTSHFEALWDLGYLPLEIRALEEGTICPIKVPMLTIHNTLPEFYWLPNFLETILSQLLWKPMTSATIAYAYKKVLTKWAEKTNPDAVEFVLWQGHDFSMRGLDSVDATIFSGLGHLTSFYGTDSLPTLKGARHYYDEVGFVGGSVVATEHAVMCAGSKEDEKGTYSRLMDTYPSGILSVVSDTWDLWNVITNIIPSLKEKIMARDGKLVIRPDSGDPADILCGVEIRHFETMEKLKDIVKYEMWEYFEENCDSNSYVSEDMLYACVDGKYYDVTGYAEIGRMHDMNDNDHYVVDGVDLKITEVELTPAQRGVIELLWDTFGGTINDQGYKVLDSHIGAIYGDSITIERADNICSRLEQKGFASTNVVLGIGSFTYQHNTRDTFGFAMKATYVERRVEGSFMIADGSVKLLYKTEGHEIFKDPITDSGMKKSAKGLMRVIKLGIGNGEIEYRLQDGLNWDHVNDEGNQLKIVFLNGELKNRTTLTEIRKRLC